MLPSKNYKINHQISAPSVRVIDEQGGNTVMSLKEAFQLSEKTGLDLIEISSNSEIPVVKLMSFDKFRYQAKKDEKKASQKNGSGELKQVRVTARSAENDLRVSAKRADKFLEEGCNVEINFVIRGREKSATMKDWVEKKFAEFISYITVEYKVTLPKKYAGRGIIMQIIKK